RVVDVAVERVAVGARSSEEHHRARRKWTVHLERAGLRIDEAAERLSGHRDGEGRAVLGDVPDSRRAALEVDVPGAGEVDVGAGVADRYDDCESCERQGREVCVTRGGGHVRLLGGGADAAIASARQSGQREFANTRI